MDVQSLHLAYSSIHDLTGLEGFLSLDTLSISELQNSDISYLDMSLVPWLKYLDCYNQNGQIDSINLSQNTDLQFLDASGNTITDLDLSNNTMLEYLTCNFNQISVRNHQSCVRILLEFTGNPEVCGILSALYRIWGGIKGYCSHDVFIKTSCHPNVAERYSVGFLKRIISKTRERGRR